MTNVLKMHFIVYFALFAAAFAAKFPLDIPQCKVGDTDCMVESANLVLEQFYSGHKGINLIPIDPLIIPKISIKQGAESPVNVELDFLNSSLTGFEKFRFYKISGFQEKIDGKYELRLKGPQLRIAGKYKINGNILILPIQGVGDSNISISNPDATIKFTGRLVTRNDKEYLEPSNIKLSLAISKIHFKLDNLYNGDKALGDNTNLFLNENWADVWPEVRKSIFEAFGQIVESILKNIFAKYPYKSYFKQ